MKKFMVFSLSALVASVLAFASPSRGDQPQDAPKATTAQKSDSRLTVDGLQKLLEGLGYEPTVTKSTDGSVTYFRIDKTVTTFRYIIDVSLQNQGKFISFSCPLRRVGEPEKVPADKLWAVLSKNDDIQPLSFSYEAGRKQFFLNLQIDNSSVTPARMQGHLDQVRHVLQSTSTVWDTSKWPGGPQPTAKAADTKVSAK